VGPIRIRATTRQVGNQRGNMQLYMNETYTLLQVEPLMDSLVPLMLAYKEDMRVRLP